MIIIHTGGTAMTGIMTATTGTVMASMSILPANQVSAILTAGNLQLPLPARSGSCGVGSTVCTACRRASAPDIQTAETTLVKQPDNEAMGEFLATQEDKAFYVAYAALWDREAAMDAVQEST